MNSRRCYLALALLGPALLPAQSVFLTHYEMPSNSAVPYSITRGPDGAMWFTEYGAVGAIGRISTAGVVTEFPLPGNRSGSGIVMGPDGALWFPEDFSASIGRITTAGVVTEYPLPTPGRVLGITVGSDGALWYSGAGKAGRITTSGAITEYAVGSGEIWGITAGPDGALWLAGSGKIFRLTTAGALTDFTISFTADAITAGPDGALWFTEFGGNHVGRITTAGAITTFTVPNATSRGAITTGPDGALWLTHFGGCFEGACGAPGSLIRITTSGQVKEFSVAPGDGAKGIALGPDGNLWFTEYLSGTVGRAVVVPSTSGNVTVTAVPAGLSVVVDGTTYPTPRSFNWAPGETHSLSAFSPQPGSTSTRFVFGSWSDGGAATHTITVPAAGATYTASFSTQYRLTTAVVPAGSGTIAINPSSADGYYNAGATVQLTATPIAPFQFSNWSSNLSGTTNPQSLVISGPRAAQANFSGPSQNFSFSEYPANYPRRLTAGPQRALWYVSNGGSNIGRITTTGVVTDFPLGATSGAPGAIAGGSDGALWFTEFTGVIGRLSTTGGVSHFPVPRPQNSSLSICACLTAGPDGALWFAEHVTSPSTTAVERIVRLTTTGVFTEYPIPSTNPGVTAITTGPDGAIWFVETTSNKIGRITTAGSVTEFAVTTPGSGLSAIATGPDGALWFAENTANKIGRITTAGAVTEFAVPTSGASIFGITGGPDGAVWFTEGSANKIGRVTSAGAVTEYPIPTAGSFPTDIAAGADGAIWFTEQFGGNMGRIVLPSASACTYSLPQATQAIAATGGNGAITVRAPAGGPGGCSFSTQTAAPWITIVSGGTGSGNGSVNFAVAANPSPAARTGVITVAGLPFTVSQSGTAAVPGCIAATASIPQVAIEGRTELLGELTLTCTGMAAALQTDVTLLLNVNITNAIESGTTDALLTVNGGPPRRGVVAGYNSLRWVGVPLPASPGAPIVLRISQVRGDATALLTQQALANPGDPLPTAITGGASLSSTVPVPVLASPQILANAAGSLAFTRSDPSPSAGGASTLLPAIFQEARPASFVAGSTRLRLSLTGIAANVQVYAPVYPLEGSGRAQLYSADSSGAGGAPVAGAAFMGGIYQQLTVSNGTATATWLVLGADATQTESYTFPLLLLNAGAGELVQLKTAGSFAPVSDVSLASSSAPVPRYRDFTVQPKLANLRISTLIQPATPAQAKSAASAVSSNITFGIQLINDTADASQTATNVVIRDNLPSGLAFVSCTSSAGACSGAGNQVQANAGTLGPGQTATLNVIARIDPSLLDGTTLENGVSATSDQVNLDLLAGTSSSSLVVLNGALVAVGGSPASGAGSSQTFTFQFSHPNGYQNLNVVNVLINNFLDGRGACYLAYVVPSRTLVLVDDAGRAEGPYAGTLIAGDPSAIQNSQCAVNLVSALGEGTLLTLKLNISFKSSFGGNKIAYIAARDSGPGNTDWQALGVWQVPYTAGAITPAAVVPGRGAAPAGTGQQFTVIFNNTNGAGNFGVLNLLINNFLDGRHACYLAYSAPTATLYLVNDAGDAGGPFAGSMLLNGGSASIQNSQCVVNGSGSTVGTAPNTLTLTLNIAFKTAFTGNRVIYIAGRDLADGNNSNWQALGTWSVQ